MPQTSTDTHIKPELLAPAGNFEKLEIAIHYGADAVYLAGKNFSLRNFSGNFSDEDLSHAVDFAHKRGVKVYAACNIYARTHEQKQIEQHLECLAKAGPDAVIISDPGIIAMAGKIIPEIPIHLSTQANTTSLAAAEFWHSLGIRRVNLARELPLDEIRQISLNSSIETEIFIHGAMCVSYSGRCLLSSFLSGRDGNRGLCSHPCRWKYHVVEELRPDQYHPVMEDNRGTYIFNSKDLCMIRHIPRLMTAGVSSLKIEGRMKGINYLASTVKTYRDAIDAYWAHPETYQCDPAWIRQLDQIFHREYTSGFYLAETDPDRQNYSNTHRGEIHSFIGKIVSVCSPGIYTVEVRNKLETGDEIEVLTPGGGPLKARAHSIQDMAGAAIPKTDPNTFARIKINQPCQVNDIVRKI